MWLTALPAALVLEEQSACFVVRDHNGQPLAYIITKKSLGGDQQLSCSQKMGSNALQ